MRISTAPNATPDSTPPTSARGRKGGDLRAVDVPNTWTSILSSLIHPTKLAILTALFDAGKPQSVRDLIGLPGIDGDSEEIQRHAREMVVIGALEISATQIEVGNEDAVYFFPQEG